MNWIFVFAMLLAISLWASALIAMLRLNKIDRRIAAIEARPSRRAVGQN